MIAKPAAGMSILGTMASVGDVRHLERMQDIVTADRRPAAILLADLEASSPLARRLSTADYFNLARRLVHADECVVEAGGLVGRHLGDGVAVLRGGPRFKLTVGDSKNEPRIGPGRDHRTGQCRAGCCCCTGTSLGATLYVGLVESVGLDLKVTALGDEVDEDRADEACASRRPSAGDQGTRRTRPEAALGLDHAIYTPLGELATATEKARRDAPAIAVSDV